MNDKVIYYENPVERVAPPCYKSVDKINSGYPPTFLCNFKNDKEMCIFSDRAQETYYRMKFNIDSDNQLRSLSSRNCNPCELSKCSELVNNNDKMNCSLNSRYKMSCFSK